MKQKKKILLFEYDMVDKNTNWSIERSCNSDCMEELTKGESEENVSEERYSLDGSNVKTDNIGRIICSEIFI